MNKFNHWLEGLTVKLTIALVVLTGLLAALRGCNVQQHRDGIGKILRDAEKKGFTPDMAFARLDGKDAADGEETKPYNVAFGDLGQRCREPRTDIAVMAAEVVRYERKFDAQTTYLDGLEYFSALVESESETSPVRCGEVLDNYVESIEDQKEMKQSRKRKRST